MIKLYDLLTEQVNTPKAIILAGAPGAGKGYVLKGLDLGGLKTMNIDNILNVEKNMDSLKEHRPERVPRIHERQTKELFLEA